MTPTSLFQWIATHRPILARTAQEHLTLSLVSLALVLVVAIPLGTMLARRPRAAGPVAGLVNTLRTIPSLALLVLMLPFLGTGFLPSMVALTLYGLPAVMLNTMIGVRDVDPAVIEAARGQGLSERQILLRIAMPLASPVILAGIRTAGVQIVSAATLAVFIGGGGLGELISAGMSLFDIPQLVVGALLVALFAFVAEVGLGLVERMLARRMNPRPA